ncbi:protein-disulfide reductase [Massilia cavernae]|uniref:Protein-disulfide reductase n=2 Tax=Massilia cavernae TaxID=2320864 RepID=A0A418XPW0_9BURK|nr:protein-disulfide reductase [Massilia cavernae]
MALVPHLAHAEPAVVVTDHVRAELVAQAPEGISPGKPLWLGLAITHQPHWHTYWKNPGDSGLPTTLNWVLPTGFVAGDIVWPTPRRLPLGPLVNYGYEGQVLLPVSVAVPADFAGSTLTVRLHAEWLVCKEICLPESGDFHIEISARSPTTSHRELFDAARVATPRAVPGASASGRVVGAALAIEVHGLPAPAQGQALQFMAEDAGVIDHAGQVEQRWAGTTLRLRVPLSLQRSESPDALKVVLSAPNQSAGWMLTIPIVGGWSAGAAASAVAVADVSAATAPAFMLALLFALAGGAMLNLMPCVFPVLSLKIFGFAQRGGDRRRAIAGGLAYTAGVVFSFIALACLLLVLRAGGEQLGWGFQLQSPVFVSVLAALFTLIGLNLAGVFEFGTLLPGTVAGYRAKNPLVDDALSGALAVAIASPCTAPFMGAALGAALTESVPRAMAIFAALGLGMAAPYLAATLWPGFARLLPRPGPWMLRFKVIMAFPMFATVVWLLWVLGQQTGVDAMAGMAGALIALAFACWTIGTPVHSRRARVLLAGSGLFMLALATALVWPALRSETAASGQAQTQGAGQWAPWSVAAVEQARTAGKPVFVDFTAAWCITCQFNKRTTLADAGLLAEFETRQVVLLRADWTRRDPAITQQLALLGRSGVPVYAIYGTKTDSPQVLSELLTVEEVRSALGNL